MKLLSKKTLSSLLMSVVGFLFFVVPTAFAGVGVGVAPDFPTTVTVGQTGVSVGLEITNNSTSDVGSVNLSNIRLVPQCGNTDADQTTCVAGEVDPGVFTIGAVGTGANACTGINFTIAENDPATGQVLFTPDATVTLAQGATCRINFTANVNRTPASDSNVAAGLQTLQTGKVFATQAVGGSLTGNGLGTDETTVSKVSPSISTLQSVGGPIGTVLNDTATLSGGSNPTGNVTFKLFDPSDATCSLAPAYTDVDTTAPYATNPGFVSTMAGVWHWTADYAGDANNNATSSPCTAEPVTIVAPGHIIVDKITDPAGDPQSFVFTTTGTGYNGFNLTDLAAPNDQTLEAGTYSVAETGVAGWDMTSASCVSSTQDVETPASISLQAGETVTCTFTNTKKGHLIVQKTTEPAGDLTVFNVNASGTGTITNGGTGTITDATDKDYEVTAGTYSVSETVPSGWTKTGDTCQSVVVAAGETKTCVITNTKQSNIIVNKVTDPAGDPQSFVFTTTGAGYNGFNLTDLAAPNDQALAAGTYGVSETPLAGWTQTSATCTSSLGGSEVPASIGLTAGETVTCTFVNTKIVVQAQYCSPGYWKQSQHFDSYVTYSPNSTFFSVFGVDAFPGKTLVQVLSTGGGGLEAYGRKAVGALLNSSALTSGLTPAEVISKFAATYAAAPSGKAANGYYGSANPEFTVAENCPLN